MLGLDLEERAQEPLRGEVIERYKAGHLIQKYGLISSPPRWTMVPSADQQRPLSEGRERLEGVVKERDAVSKVTSKAYPSEALKLTGCKLGG